jgi:hypothetical protein
LKSFIFKPKPEIFEKNLLPVMAIVISFLACSKNKAESDSIVTFTQNNENFEIRGVRDFEEMKKEGAIFLRDSGNNEPGSKYWGLYTLGFQDRTGRRWSISTFPINKPELKTYRTTYDNTWKIGFHSSSVTSWSPYKHFYIYSGDDFAEITITRIHNGRVDGTFSARLTDLQYYGDKQINITNGVFTNCRLAE